MDVSIIVPCYNAMGKIEVCLRSLREQLYSTDLYEVIFIDDCSNDGTYTFLYNEIQKESNWSLYQLEQNSGSPSRPRNIGLTHARGKYVFFLDSDDEIFADTLKEHYQHAQKTNADIVRGYLIVDEGNKRDTYNRLSPFLSEDKNKRIEAIISKQSTTVPTLIKRLLLVENQIIWPEEIRMGEDTLFLIHALNMASKIEYIDHPTFVYNKKASAVASSTQMYGNRELLNHLRVWQEAHNLLIKNGINYLQIRLQIGLQAALQNMVKYNSYDINKGTFNEFTQFVNTHWKIIETFNYSHRLKSLLSVIQKGDFDEFIEHIKPRLVIAGHDLKFIKSAIPFLQEFYQIRLDEWSWHDRHDAKWSEKCINWCDIIFCEWLLGNAIWYANHKKNHQKLFVRLHRFELTTVWPSRLDLTKVDRFIAVSVYFAEKLIEYTNVPRGKVKVIPNFLNEKLYKKLQSPEKLFNIGMIGILPSRKGFDQAIEIFEKLYNMDNRYHLHIFGHTPMDLDWIKNDPKEMDYYQACAERIKELGLVDSITYRGWVNVQEELAHIGFVLSTSYRDELFESFHLAPADGFAAGNQGLLLNWSGVEYIYPPQYIFESIDHMVEHIHSQRDITVFNQFNREGYELIVNRYGIDSFVVNLKNLFRH
jgi:glycosyltransferase involved in cell wall biosynthesis